MMWEHAADQIKSIHAMLDSGHRSVRLERHTLVAWGLAGAGLILVMRFLFPPENFSVQWQRILVVHTISIIVLVSVAIWDVRVTRRLREARDESLSFIQMQLTKVWWSIVAMIILISIGMSFFGGGYLFFAILLSLLGLAFYIHGLFSQQLLSWVGAIMILLGLLCIALRLPIVTQEWLTVMTLGIGLPSLSYLTHHQKLNTNTLYRIGGFAVWLVLIIGPTLAMDQWQRNVTVPELPVQSLADFQRSANTLGDLHIVRLPAGSSVPVKISVKGDILADDNVVVLPLQLTKALDIMVRGETPTGWYRVGDSQWHDKRYKYHLHVNELSGLISRIQGPKISVNLFITTDN